MFSILVDIFYPSAGTVFSKEGVFQQPRLFSTVMFFRSSDAPSRISGVLAADISDGTNHEHAIEDCECVQQRKSELLH